MHSVIPSAGNERRAPTSLSLSSCITCSLALLSNHFISLHQYDSSVSGHSTSLSLWALRERGPLLRSFLSLSHYFNTSVRTSGKPINILSLCALSLMWSSCVVSFDAGRNEELIEASSAKLGMSRSCVSKLSLS